VSLAVRSKAVTATALFVLGFTVVFVAQSVAVIGFSRALLVNSETLMRVGGGVTIVMGLAMLGLIRPLQTERRLHTRPTGRIFGAPLLGAVFALGWTVCLGPTLVGVLSLANATDWGGSAWRGLSLVIFYCLGLGVPFLLLAFGFSWATGAMGFLRRHTRTIQIVGAVCLIVLGTLMLTGIWANFIAWLQGRFAGIETLL
jgi:cytochrome c-type biogenesis protein